MKLADQVKQKYEQRYKKGKTPWIAEEVEKPVIKFVELVNKEFKKPNLLDIGCGNGWLSVYFAEQGIKTTGIDVSETAIRQARSLATKNNLRNIEFRIGDALDFPYSENEFNIVFDRGLFHHQPEAEWERYLKGLKKVLKKGGLFFLVVFSDTMREKKTLPGKNYYKGRDDTGHFTYNHYFSKKDIKEILGKEFLILKTSEGKGVLPGDSSLYFFTMRKK